MEWHTNDSDSDLSVWSDSEDENRPATAAELRHAYLSEASLPDDAPRNDMRLRKQETSYAHRRVTDTTPVLSAYGTRPGFASLDDAFGTPVGDDREMAGYLVDSDGQPYAKIMESKPPPPNTNRLGQSHKHNLRRALGYDPHVVRRKGEPVGVTNGADTLNGDADIADSRHRTKKSLLARGDAFHNQTHTHEFADVDTGRSIYDGHNADTRDFEKRRTIVEHTWRNAVRQEHDPSRAAAQLPTSPVHGQASTVRKETSAPFPRTAHATHSTVQLDATMHIPVVAHKSMREGSAPADRVVESHVGVHRAASGDADLPPGEREMQQEASVGDVAVSARRAEARLAQREGGDDGAVDRQAAATALVALGQSQHALAAAGGTDVRVVAAEGGAHSVVGQRLTDGVHDAAAPKRADTDHLAALTPHAGGGAVVAASCVDIGEDRVPVAPCAMWHFSVAQGDGASRHRPAQPETSAIAGTCFLNDRLAQPNASDWRLYDKRTAPAGCDSGYERLTPVPHERRGEPPLQQMSDAGRSTQLSGRTTPLTRPAAPSPMALR